MKKFLAVVLALVMTLAMGTAAFAYVEVAPGQIYVGPAAVEYFANPGETIDLGFRYAGNPNETDGYPTDGYVVLPLFGAFGDVNFNVVNSVELTQEAIDAGVTFIENENSAYNTFFTPEDGLFFGALMMPASLVASDFTVFTVNTTISADWVVNDYVAQDPISIQFAMGSEGMGDGWFVTDDDAALIAAGEITPEEAEAVAYVAGLISDYSTIQAKPYQPTWEEAFTEQLKGLGAGLIDVLIIALNLLKGELEPADWFIPGEHDVVDLSFITDGIAMLVGMILNG